MEQVEQQPPARPQHEVNVGENPVVRGRIEVAEALPVIASPRPLAATDPVVTRNGRPAAVLISPDDLESLELLADCRAIEELVEAEAAVAVGDVVLGVDDVRALRPSSTR